MNAATRHLEAAPEGTVTVDEFLAWPGDGRPGKWQLVDGEITLMSPASTAHGTIQATFAALLFQHMKTRGGRYRIITEPAVQPRVLSEVNLRVPDLAVTFDPGAAGEVIVPDPVVIVEILSPGNAKLTLANVWTYATLPSVRDIIVLQSSRIEADVYSRAVDGSWPSEAVRVSINGILRVPSLDFETALREVYATTYLDPAAQS